MVGNHKAFIVFFVVSNVVAAGRETKRGNILTTTTANISPQTRQIKRRKIEKEK